VGTILGNSSGTTISNCQVTNATVTATDNAGGLAGVVANVSSSSSTGSVVVTTATAQAGGLVADVTSGTVSSSWSNANVQATAGGAFIGGLIGVATTSSITNSYATGNVTDGGTGVMAVGGLAGGAYSGTTIVNSYSTGSVTGNTLVGGLVGHFSGGAAQVSNCYSTSNVVSTSSFVGGLVGTVQTTTAGASIDNSYARGTVTINGGSAAGGLVGRFVIGTVVSVTNNYATGVVAGAGLLKGGFAGSDINGGTTNAVYTANYWDNLMNGAAFGAVGGGVPAGVVGAPTATMQNTATFSGAGWTTTYWNLSTVGQHLKVIWQP
jgi:hypothetical protein